MWEIINKITDRFIENTRAKMSEFLADLNGDLGIACTWGIGIRRLYPHTVFTIEGRGPDKFVFTTFRLNWNQTDSVRLVPNQSENGKYNLISV